MGYVIKNKIMDINNRYASIVKPVDKLTQILKLAYDVADDNQCNVYAITTPRDVLETVQNLPYVVMEEEANEWEKKHGQFIQWRLR